MSSDASIFDRHRPYFDLGDPVPNAPFPTLGIAVTHRELTSGVRGPRIMTSMGPDFRMDLIAAAGIGPSGAATRSAFDLDPAQRSDRWMQMCRLLEHFDEQPIRTQVNLGWLLVRLALFDDVQRLVPASLPTGDLGPDDAELILVRLFTQLHSDSLDLATFQWLSDHAPPSTARVEATYQLVLHHAKYRGSLAETEYWMQRLIDSIDEWGQLTSRQEHLQLMSLRHRVGGFVPMIQGDASAVVGEMDLAERYAAEMPRTTEDERISADEMTFYMLESRIKEALWLGDPGSAVVRAERLVELSPLDARAWLTRGESLLAAAQPETAVEAYLRAAALAPPGAEVAHFMAGQCLEALDDLPRACDAYRACLDTDPMAISAAEALMHTAEASGANELADWARKNYEALVRSSTHQGLVQTTFYREAPPPVA